MNGLEYDVRGERRRTRHHDEPRTVDTPGVEMRGESLSHGAPHHSSRSQQRPIAYTSTPPFPPFLSAFRAHCSRVKRGSYFRADGQTDFRMNTMTSPFSSRRLNLQNY